MIHLFGSFHIQKHRKKNVLIQKVHRKKGFNRPVEKTTICVKGRSNHHPTLQQISLYKGLCDSLLKQTLGRQRKHEGHGTKGYFYLHKMP